MCYNILKKCYISTEKEFLAVPIIERNTFKWQLHHPLQMSRYAQQMSLNLHFFCIESVAERLHQDPVKVYNALTKDSDLLNSYIVPLYDILHTQSKQYIVDDIIEVMKSRGIDI